MNKVHLFREWFRNQEFPILLPEAFEAGFEAAKSEALKAIEIGPMNEVIERLLHLGEEEV